MFNVCLYPSFTNLFDHGIPFSYYNFEDCTHRPLRKYFGKSELSKDSHFFHGAASLRVLACSSTTKLQPKGKVGSVIPGTAEAEEAPRVHS